MAKPIILCADSTCDLSEELLERYNIHIFPLHIVLGDRTYQDGVDLVPDQIYQIYREKKILPTSRSIPSSPVRSSRRATT